jgi:hypothetical protein
MSPTEIQPDDLTAALRAERPQPSMRFTERLDERVEQGFPRSGAVGELRQAFGRIPIGWPRVVSAAATATAVVIGLGIAISQPGLGGSSGGTSQPPSAIEPVTSVPATPHATQARKVEGVPLANYSDGDVATSSAPGGERTGGGQAADSKVERSAQLTLAARPSEVENVADRAFDVIDRHHGIVRSSSVTGGDVGAGAQLDLLIPTRELTATIGELSDLAHVRSRTAGTQDVTPRFNDAARRLAAARAEREKLLGQLATAPSASAADAIRAQLRLETSRIASARAELDSLNRRVRLTPLQLSIAADKAAPSNHRWGLGDAADDAVRVLAVAAGAALVGLAAIVPLALLVALYLAGYRAWQRRSRARALGQSG